MGVTVFGTTGRVAEIEVHKFGIEIRDQDGQRHYPADPVEVGEVALLALTDQGPEGTKAWAVAGGERLLRAYWFLSPPGPGAVRELAARVSAGVEANELIKELEKLAVGLTKRAIFGFSEEELKIEDLQASSEETSEAENSGSWRGVVGAVSRYGYSGG